MAKQWLGAWLLGSCLSLAGAVHGQQMVPPLAPQSDPLPTGPSRVSPYITGSLTSKDAPPGPGQELGLTPDVPNAFGVEVCNDPWSDVDGGFRFNAGILWVKPVIKEKTAFTTFPLGRQPNEGPTSTVDFTYDGGTAPWVEMEYLFDSGWGVRTRYFHFFQSAPTLGYDNFTAQNVVQSATPLPGYAVRSAVTTNVAGLLPEIHSFPERNVVYSTVPGSTVGFTSLDPSLRVAPDHMTFGSNFFLDVWDIEATRYLMFERFQLVLSLGLRYAFFSASYKAIREDVGGRFERPLLEPTEPEVETFDVVVERDFSMAEYRQTFRGFGPMYGVEVRFPLSQIGLSLYGVQRGALEIGRRQQMAVSANQYGGKVLFSQIDDAPGFPIVFNTLGFTVANSNTTKLSRGDIVPMFDFEGGLEWDLGGFSHSVHPVVQVGGFYQTWLGAGSPTNPNGKFVLPGLKVTVGLQF